MTMSSIMSLGVAALVATMSSVSAETTIAVLEFGPGGSVRRSTSSTTEASAAAVSSFWDALHRPSPKRVWNPHAGMSVAADLFTAADAGIVVGVQGEGLKLMRTIASLMDAEETADNVVGHLHVPGQARAELVRRAAASAGDAALLPQEAAGERLQLAADAAARGAVEGIAVVSLAADDAAAAKEADAQLDRMLKTLKERAAASGKTVVLHLVAEDAARRRLEDNKEGEGDNGNGNAYAWNEKTIYEIQTFNLYLWTSVGIFLILAMAMSAFIGMPLMPDTLLFGECKMGAD